MTNPFFLWYTVLVPDNCIRACDEIGRHARFRFSCGNAWGFESLQAHQLRNSYHRSVSGFTENCTLVGISSLSAPTRFAGLGADQVKVKGIRAAAPPFQAANAALVCGLGADLIAESILTIYCNEAAAPKKDTPRGVSLLWAAGDLDL